MPYQIRFNEKLLHIENIVSGILSKDELDKSTADGIALQQKHSAYSILINASQLESVDSVTDLYQMPKQYSELGVSRSTRIALVMPELEKARKFVRFYETVCMNRGWTVRSFETQGEAEMWLASSQP
ncbi:MAG: hypothetical protein OEY72_13680 [Gammaproteobacteria bacterium]|nr:hypothetical protein [Gammaproteobacteria bacterium]